MDRVSAEEREWLLEGLRELVVGHGAERFLTGRILEPTPRDFPDRFHPDVESVGLLLGRILSYAGLDRLRIDLETFSQPDEIRELDWRGGAARWGHDGTAAWFAGIESGRARFGIALERIQEPERLVATLCHEVAHAWRHVHGLQLEDRDVEERLTDLSTVYLGFGILTTNGAYMYRASGGMEGSMVVTRWSHSRAGYLSPEAMSFLLAAQVRARGLGWLERRRIAATLEPNQASHYRWSLRKLGDREELWSALGLSSVVA